MRSAATWPNALVASGPERVARRYKPVCRAALWPTPDTIVITAIAIAWSTVARTVLTIAIA